PEIADPAPEVQAQFLGHPFDANPSGPARQFPNPLLEPLHRLRRDAPFRRFGTREAEAQKLPFPWLGHRAFGLVHLKLKLRADESREALHHSFSRPLTAHVDVAVVRISREAVTTS